jgi:DNA-binding transcriptional ArsR family regulator
MAPSLVARAQDAEICLQTTDCKEVLAKSSLHRYSEDMAENEEQQADAAARSEQRHNADRVLDSGALRALAHPLRVRIYDILSQYGPQTASSLAERLGESSGSTSYHLRALAKQDLIREAPDRGTGRERWWERPVGGVSFANPDAMATPAGRAATQVVMNEFLRNRNDQLLEFVNRGIGGEDESWQDGTLISTATARLTPEQSKQLTLQIMAVIDEAVDNYRNQTGENVRPVTIRADVFPLPQLGGQS